MCLQSDDVQKRTKLSILLLIDQLIKCDGNHQAYDFKKCEQSLTKQTILIREVVAKNADNLEWFHIMSYSAY